MKTLGDGRFVFEESPASLLGRGAFAAVYRGREKESGAEVAVKVLSPTHVKRSELELIQSLDSDFVVRIHGLFAEAERFYVVMELCDCTLLEHLERRLAAGQGPLRPENLRCLVHCLGQGYAAIHAQNILHRDLKPENILIRYAKDRGQESEFLIESAKIADFGSSRLSDEAGAERTGLAGTPLYMAPEVGANVLAPSAYDARVDMWSLGCLLFHASQGSAPFDEGRLCKLFLAATARNYAAYEPPPMTSSTPAPMAELIRRLLQLDPDARLSPAELARESRRFAPKSAPGGTAPASLHWLLKSALVHLRDFLLL